MALISYCDQNDVLQQLLIDEEFVLRIGTVSALTQVSPASFIYALSPKISDL